MGLLPGVRFFLLKFRENDDGERGVNSLAADRIAGDDPNAATLE